MFLILIHRRWTAKKYCVVNLRSLATWIGYNLKNKIHFFLSKKLYILKLKSTTEMAAKSDDQIESLSVFVEQQSPMLAGKHNSQASIPGMIEEKTLNINDKTKQDGREPIKLGNADTEYQTSVFIKGRYQNPWATWKPPMIWNVLKFMMSKDESNIPKEQDLDVLLPIANPNFESIPKEGISVTWIGHATTLVQFDGVTILTDPIFSNRCAPSQLIGPKRYRKPPCLIKDLPEVHAVVISHNHYDHLDADSVSQLNERFGADLRWFVPMNLASWMQKMGCKNVIELDWWESSIISDVKNVTVVLTPAQHWSKRTMFDDFKTLWGSWCIIGPKHRFFFAGDTGYCEVFRQIGRRYGPFDLAAIPIGAYEPRWFMKYQHVNPEDAVQIHEDVRSKRSVAIHWGTFALAHEFYLAPQKELEESLEKKKIPKTHFFTLMHGETRCVQP